MSHSILRPTAVDGVSWLCRSLARLIQPRKARPHRLVRTYTTRPRASGLDYHSPSGTSARATLAAAHKTVKTTKGMNLDIRITPQAIHMPCYLPVPDSIKGADDSVRLRLISIKRYFIVMLCGARFATCAPHYLTRDQLPPLRQMPKTQPCTFNWLPDSCNLPP